MTPTKTPKQKRRTISMKNNYRDLLNQNDFSLLRIIFPALLVFGLTSCDFNKPKATAGLTFAKMEVEKHTQESVFSFLEEETELSNFRKTADKIYTLNTLLESSKHQVILFAPADEAFAKLSSQDQEKLLNPQNFTERHWLFKNSIVLHEKELGEWDGRGTTYGDTAITYDEVTGIVQINNKQAHVLKKIQLQNGHLLYLIDNILS